jgi:hypothetical protein
MINWERIINNQLPLSEDVKNFIRYCSSFYSDDDAIMQMKVPDQVMVAACFLLSQRKDTKFDGDSFDREMVREVLQLVGYKENLEL